jgi:predicted GNAT family N-acyltransferase
MAALPSEVARRLTGERLPGYPMPVALIGRLANDQRVRGSGVGAELLGNAIRTVLEASSLIACLGIIVDAKDERALAFYTRYAFTPITAEGSFPRRCFLHLATAAAAMKGSE